MVNTVFQLFDNHSLRSRSPLFLANSPIYISRCHLLCKFLTKRLPVHKRTFTPSVTSK